MSSVPNAAARCLSVASEIRCELVAGHPSAHAAHDGEVTVHWRNEHAPGDRDRHVAFDWADQSVD